MKTLSIKNINIGRFGNKLMYLNNLFQVSAHYGFTPKWPSFECDLIFKFTDSRNEPSLNTKEVTSDFLLENKDFNFKPGDYELGFALGSLFFEFDNLSTNNIFEFKDKFIIDNTQKTKKIGIHFRGTDFRNWDPMAILPFQYYSESIKYVLENLKKDGEELVFFICTDDLALESYTKTIELLKKENQIIKLGLMGDMIHDFTNLSFCDVIISSPSTFAIAASFCGKEEKTILNSKFWIDYRLQNKDTFWAKVYDGGNKNYKNHKTI